MDQRNIYRLSNSMQRVGSLDNGVWIRLLFLSRYCILRVNTMQEEVVQLLRREINRL